MSDKKQYKPSKPLSLDQALAQMAAIKPNPLENEVRINKDVGCMHHDMSYIDGSGKQFSYNVELPIRPSSAIIATTDAKTLKWSLFMCVDFFEAWPVRDEEGEKMMRFFEQSHQNYCSEMEKSELLEIKKKLLKGTKQYDPKENKELADADKAMKLISMASRVKSPILWPEIKEGEPNAGDIDKSRSPYFILKIWEEEKKKDQVFGAKDLVVNGGRQKIHGTIYDRTENLKASACKTEEEFTRLLYHKGSAKQGAEMFTLDVLVTLMPMTAYFPMEKKADCQFKHQMIIACGKHASSGNFGLSPEQEKTLMSKVMTYHARRGIESPTETIESNKSPKTVHGQGPSAGAATSDPGNMLTTEEEREKADYDRAVEEAQRFLPGNTGS